MDVGRHQVPDRLVYEAVPSYDRHARKTFGNDTHREMTSTVRRAGVTCVQVTVVDHPQFDWLQRLDEARGEPIGPRR